MLVASITRNNSLLAPKPNLHRSIYGTGILINKIEVIVHRAVFFFFAMLFDINIESLLFCLDRHYVEMCSSGWLSKFKVVFYVSSQLF